MNKKVVALGSALLIFTQTISVKSAVAVPLRISHCGVSSTALTAGQSWNVTFSLGEPIICPGSPCDVTLNWVNSNPSKVSLSSSSLVWSSLEWNQTRSLTLTVNSNLVHSDPSSVTISTLASSNSEYYRNFAISITQNIQLPLSPEQILANERAAAAVAALEAARLHQLEIENFRAILFAKFLKGLRPTLSDYNNAAFNQVSIRTVDTVTDRVLALPVSQRSDATKITQIAEDALFIDEVFNPDNPASIETYLKYSFYGVTARILGRVNSRVQEFPLIKRIGLNWIQEVINEELFVDRLANPVTRSTVTSAILASRGLLNPDYPRRHSIINGLASYPESSLNTMTKIEVAIREQIEKAEASKRRTAEIKAKITARKK